MFATLFRDFQIAHVVDMTLGSGAACLAALYCKVTYGGLAHNEAHATWLRDILQRMFVAMIDNKDIEVDTELRKNVTTYLSRSTEAAKVLLPKFAAKYSDGFTGDDDSDNDE